MTDQPTSILILAPKTRALHEPLVAPERYDQLIKWIKDNITSKNEHLAAHAAQALTPLMKYDLATIANAVDVQLKAARYPEKQKSYREPEKERQQTRMDGDKLLPRLFSSELRQAKQLTNDVDAQVRTLLDALVAFKGLPLKQDGGKDLHAEERLEGEAKPFITSVVKALNRAGMERVAEFRVPPLTYGLHAPENEILGIDPTVTLTGYARG